MTDAATALLASQGIPDPQVSLRDFLVRQRWFAGRGRAVARVEVEDAAVLRPEDPTVLFTVVRVGYRGAAAERYHVPVAVREQGLTHQGDPDALIADAVRGGRAIAAYDALVDPECAVVLFDLIERDATVATEVGELRFRDIGPASLAGGGAETVVPLRRQQTNTSVIRDDRELLKCMRRIEDGTTPELEMTSALAAAGVSHALEPLGAVEYLVPGHEPALVGIVQPYLRNATDGLALALTSLRVLYADAEDSAARHDPGALRRAVDERGSTFTPESARLGEATAEMHLALARKDLPPALRPERLGDRHLREWSRSMVADLERLLRRDGELARLRARQPELARRFEELRELDPSGLAIRLHGDLHLGNTVRSDSGWTILDFEGEPRRSLEERRRRSSPLRDVAGMLRSLDYAAALAAAERSDPSRPEWQLLLEHGDAWSAVNRAAFWDAYRERVAGSGLLPDERATRALLRAFELDKAVYEVGYELAHRPEWVEIPLRFLLREVAP